VKSFTTQVPLKLNEGTNNISILSVMVGLPVMYLAISIYSTAFTYLLLSSFLIVNTLITFDIKGKTDFLF